MLARLFDAVGDRIALYNVYGPTECTCICSVYAIGSSDLREMTGYAPLGHVIPNFSYVIVDDALRQVEPGQVGELCLGGPCVGLGYYNDAAQTAQAFIQNPVHDRFFDRVYRTGDLVRLDPADAKIHYLGRADSQIKHQGYRIELGEIEHALAAVEGVDEAAAVYVSSGGTGRIVGVIASRRGLVSASVKQALVDTLPKYMIPDRVVVVDRLLKNANGKIDRKAIAAVVEHGAAMETR
jgi:D-alanine--poly(phosphoribitol) ligase subunit 1